MKPTGVGCTPFSPRALLLNNFKTFKVVGSNIDMEEKNITPYIFFHSTPWDMESGVLVAAATTPFTGLGETED